jgi:hypothetical protein
MTLRRLVAIGGAFAFAACASLSGLTSGTDAGLADAALDGAAGETGVDDAATSDAALTDAAPDGVVAAPPGCGAADAGLLAYWPIEEGQGTAIADCSGNGQNGTLIGNAIWVAGRRPTTKALSFDATNGTYVDVPSSALVDGLTAITVAAWVDLGAGVNSYVATKGGDINHGSWSLEMEGNATVSFYISSNGVVFSQANSDAGPTDTWFHIAGVFDPGKTQTLYVNGVAVNSVPPPFGMYQGTEPIKLGYNTKGAIDEVRIFSRALSAAEIAALAAE